MQWASMSFEWEVLLTRARKKNSHCNLQLSFVELTVFVQFYELVERFLAILVLDFDVQVVKPDHPVPFGDHAVHGSPEGW